MSNNTQNMQIFTIIGQLEDMIERSPKPKLGNSASKRVIDAEEMIDLLGDLKVTIPEDIRRANSVMIEAQTMIDNADEHAREVVANAQDEADRLIAQAHATANDIVEKARQEYERLVQEDEIYQEAQRRAELLAKKAEANASLVFENAKCYADDVLKDLESFLGEYKQLVSLNRKDLDARTQQEAAVPATAPQQEYQAPAAEQPAPQQRRKKPAPVEESYDDFDENDEFEDDAKGGGFLGGLFKRKKKVDEIDFDDEE